MKIYRVIDNSIHIDTITDLAELGKWFLRLVKKYPENTWYWVDEETI